MLIHFLVEDGITLWMGNKEFMDYSNKEKTNQGIERQIRKAYTDQLHDLFYL